MRSRCRNTPPQKKMAVGTLGQRVAFMTVISAMDHLLAQGREQSEEGTFALHILAQAAGRIMEAM